MKATNATVTKARPPSAPPIIGPKEGSALDEATDVVPEVANDIAGELGVGEGSSVEEGTSVDVVEFNTIGVIAI